jgi:hypothetical protein
MLPSMLNIMKWGESLMLSISHRAQGIKRNEGNTTRVHGELDDCKSTVVNIHSRIIGK